MIKDNIININKYAHLPERVKFGLNYLVNTDFSKVESGRYEIEGNEVFAIIQEYAPKQLGESKFEAHKKYIDIQYVIEGEEKIGVGDLSSFSDATEYSEDKDIVFLTPNADCAQTFVEVCEKEFVILYPQDAHLPSIELNNRKHVKKAVVKVLV